MNESLVLYASSWDALAKIEEKLRKLGYRVETRLVNDTSSPVLEGPFGRIKGFKEIMIILRQLEASGGRGAASSSRRA